MGLGAHLRGNACFHAGNQDLAAAKKDMEAAEKNRYAACSRDRASQECSELNFWYEHAVGEYHLQQRRHQDAYRDCLLRNAFGSFDPIQQDCAVPHLHRSSHGLTLVLKLSPVLM